MKKFLFITLLMFFSLNIFCQQPQRAAFYLLVFSKTVDYCTSDYKYSTQMLPIGIDYKLRNKINKKQKKGLEISKTKKLNYKYLSLNLNDWVTIFEVTYKLCDKKNNIKKIFMIKTSDKENSQSHIDALINKEIHIMQGMIERYYVSHKILKRSFQPFKKMDEQSIIKWFDGIVLNFFKWLDDDEKKELKKQFKRSTAIGVRG